jgi:allantoinase
MHSDRRNFIRQSLALAGTASLVGSGLVPSLAQAQTLGPMRRSNRYDDTYINERKPFTWPGNKTLAVWIAPNVEVWHYDLPSGQAVTPNTANRVPDVVNFSWREYGIRVGLWRLADVLDANGMKATVALNSQFCETFPKAMDEMKKRGWEFMGHGTTNSESLQNLSPDKEKEVIAHVLSTIEKASGKKPRGWLGTGLTETANTLDILAENGVIYTGDWQTDDQPVAMKAKSGKIYSLPYCMEVNDIGQYGRKGYTGDQYYRALMDQFDQLLLDSRRQPRVLGIPLHPMISGQPLRIKYLARALADMKKHDRVWFATGSEIIDAYQRANPTA